MAIYLPSQNCFVVQLNCDIVLANDPDTVVEPVFRNKIWYIPIITADKIPLARAEQPSDYLTTRAENDALISSFALHNTSIVMDAQFLRVVTPDFAEYGAVSLDSSGYSVKFTDPSTGFYAIQETNGVYVTYYNDEFPGGRRLNQMCIFNVLIPNQTLQYFGIPFVCEHDGDTIISYGGAAIEWYNHVRLYGSISAAISDPNDVVLKWLNSITTEIIRQDPYDGIPESTPGGNGDGTFDFSSTPIDFAGLPGIGAMDTGMIDLYVPSAAQLRALSNYLWAGAFDPDNFKKLLADPMDAIIGLSIVPVSASEIGTTAATLAVGNISTGLAMPKAVRQYVSIDCGSISVLPKYGAYLDFAPNSKLQLFLPYIGYVPISPDDCMNGTISVRYSVDILGGTCIAQVKCNDHVLYEFSGQCSCSCPVTAGQYQNIALTALKLAGSVAGIAAGGAAGLATGLENAANSIISSAKPEVSRSGGFGGSSGLMGHQVPYLILTIPKMARPGQQNSQMGYPSFVTKVLSSLAGYIEVDTVHLTGVPATDAEQEEIITLLQGGVYV